MTHKAWSLHVSTSHLGESQYYLKSEDTPFLPECVFLRMWSVVYCLLAAGWVSVCVCVYVL